jgi:hypothetical protein
MLSLFGEAEFDLSGELGLAMLLSWLRVLRRAILHESVVILERGA